jgi:uncharacterized protein
VGTTDPGAAVRSPSEGLIVRPEEIAFDVDGVFADTFRTFVDTARRDYGCSFSYEEITEYDFRTVVEIEERASEAIIARMLEDPIGSGIEPLPGAVDVLTRLAAIAPLLFVTARPEETAIRGWIRHYLPGVPEDAVRVVATGTGENKRSVLLDHGVACFVEDCLETGFLIEPYRVRPVIFDQPWNRKPHPFHVVKSWRQIDAMLDWPRG